jgi:hypothetical protein
VRQWLQKILDRLQALASKPTIRQWLIVLGTLTVIVLAIAFNPMRFRQEGSLIVLGEYDYTRMRGQENPNYYELHIEPGRFGNQYARRTAKAAAADLAIRLGYSDVAMLKVKKHKNEEKQPIITVQVYLYNRLQGQSPPKHAKSTFNAYAHTQKEKHIIFLEDLLQLG